MKIFYDLKTKNESFLKIYKHLKDTGIKNNKFFLTLYDQDLVEVDPYDSSLTDNLKIRIIRECTINIWYYLREVLRIPCEFGDSVKFTLTKGSLASTYLFLNSIDHLKMQSRTTYSTISVLGIFSWAYIFGLMNSDILLYDKRPDDSKLQLAHIKSIIQALPDYINKPSYFNNTNKSNNNKICIGKYYKSRMHIGEAARGYTQQLQLFNDAEFIEDLYTILSTSAPAFSASKQLAMQRNSIGCRIFTSTINKDVDPFMIMLLGECAIWEDNMYDMSGKDIRTMLYMSNSNGIIFIKYKYKDLGFSEEWFREQCACLRNDAELIKHEILLER